MRNIKKQTIIYLLIYLISIFTCYKTIQHKFNTEWLYIKPDTMHIIFCFLPVFNTSISIIWNLDFLFDESVNFFNITKRKGETTN